MFKIYRVRGNSMQPTLNEGDYVVAFSRLVCKFVKPKIGTLIVVDHPEEGVMIKRVAEVLEKHVRLVGDNQAESITSAVMGNVEFQNIIGRVFYLSRKS